MDLRKKRQELLSDCLPYFKADPQTGVIWLKDGSAVQSVKVVPKDCALLTDDDLESLRAGLTPILNQLPDGSILQAILLREFSTRDRDDAYTRWITSHRGLDKSLESREMLFSARQGVLEHEFEESKYFHTRCYLTLRILPDTDPKPGKNLGPLAHLGFKFQGKKTAVRTRDQLLQDLSSGVQKLSTGLAALGFDLDHVSHEERVQVIYEWLNPERSQVIPAPMLRDASSLSDQVNLTDLVERKTGIALGRTELSIASMKSPPEFTIPGAMQSLACASNPFSLLVTIYVLPQTQERERLLRKQRLAQGMASGNQVRNLMAEAQLRDIEDTLGALISSGEKLLGVSFHMIGRKDAA